MINHFQMEACIVKAIVFHRNPRGRYQKTYEPRSIRAGFQDYKDSNERQKSTRIIEDSPREAKI